ncbi:hypothetical protein [Streptomyces sp. NPDC049881]|uniref:hypothetical protein n=1 Tax=Streptomyces sp. NPDC049881 TaxID=3155778 RepID=UPI003429C319
MKSSRCVAAALFLCGFLLACSGEDRNGEARTPAPTMTDRSEACGVMDGPGVTAALEEITGSPAYVAHSSTGFGEITEGLTREVGVPDEGLRDGGYEMCVVYESQASSIMTLTITYSTARSYQLTDDGDLPEGSRVYPMGREAHASSDRAVLFLDCVVPTADGRSTTLVTDVARWGVYADTGQESAMMTVAHAAAFALAGEMGCEDDGGLTEEPDLRPVE